MIGLSASAGPALLALAVEEKIPNEQARLLSPTVGWLMLACAIIVFCLFILQNERWRRFWLTLEDPRSIGLFRIVFAFFVICNINDLWEYFVFLFTDEGLFTADVARQVFAQEQFKGFGDGWTEEEPWGFFDFTAFLHFVKGPKYSLLYLWDTPTFFWAHLWTFEIVTFLFMIGLWSRITGFVSLLLMNSLMVRNHLFWEGTELVYRVFFAYLLLAKSGHAYSMDNWLRCRRLRQLDRLSERGAPSKGAGSDPTDLHPRGLEAIYRLIPSWPRKLMMLQLVTIYSYTGIVKNGAVWARGDAFYYAFNMDHFYRFYPQRLSAVFGTNVFRLMTWVTHWWEVFFPLCFLGIVIRWSLRDGSPTLDTRKRGIVRALWTSLGLAALAICTVTYPVHYVPPREGPSLLTVQWLFGVGWLLGMGLVGWAFWRFFNKPFRVRMRGKTHVLGAEWFGSWVLGRKWWLTLGIVFQLHLLILMNIGQFQTGMLAANIVFLTGFECAAIMRLVGRKLGNWNVPLIPDDVKRGEPPLPAEDPTLSHLRRDAARLPAWVMFAALAIVVLAILIRYAFNPDGWVRIWGGAFLLLAAVAWLEARKARGRTLSVIDPVTGRPRVPWAYGQFGRFVVNSLLVWQITAVATWLLPEKDSVWSFRGVSRSVFSKWLLVTQTDQSWGMFAPNPPRSNVFLKILVTDKAGETYDMRTDVYAPERKPIPWIWNDRWRKMARRISGGESGQGDWYQKWIARYHCRQWALTHDGESPEKVDLVKIWYRIPTPEHVRDKGYYDPEELLARTGQEKYLYTEKCDSSITGQLPNWIRERHGLEPLPEGVRFKPWIKHKKRAWERKYGKDSDKSGTAESAQATAAQAQQDAKETKDEQGEAPKQESGPQDGQGQEDKDEKQDKN